MTREEILRLFEVAKNRNIDEKVKMKTIKTDNWGVLPKDFTGILEYSDRAKFWYKEGNLHREDGSAVEMSNGMKCWFKEGKVHRVDGPAVEYPCGEKLWYKDDKRHRIDGPAIEKPDGYKEWWLDGKEYSEKDWKAKVQELKEPKVKTIKINNWSEIPESFTGVAEWPDGTKYWYKEGMLHREDGPAAEYSDGIKYWYKEGLWHREDGPAIEGIGGHKEWYKEGKCHRLDGPAVERQDGSKFWYKNDNLHREDGPAVEKSNGDKEWWIEGKLHRLDGPAREYSDGHKEWWNEGKKLSLVESVATEQILGASKTKPSKVRQVAIRVASRQVIKHVGSLITKTLTQGFKTSESQKLISWFKSEAGSAVLMVLVGKILPRFEALLPEEYKPLFSEIAEEIEIETMVDLTDGIVDSIAAAMVSFDFNSFQFFNSESETAENVRVETLSAPTVTPWESVSETPAVHSEIKVATS